MSTVNMVNVKVAEFELAERLVRLKYPNLNIVEGSLVQELAHPVYSNKRRVTVVCSCGTNVERATSDLHTFKGCAGCKKASSKVEKMEKKIALLEALATAQS